MSNKLVPLNLSHLDGDVLPEAFEISISESDRHQMKIAAKSLELAAEETAERIRARGYQVRHFFSYETERFCLQARRLVNGAPARQPGEPLYP